MAVLLVLGSVRLHRRADALSAFIVIMAIMAMMTLARLRAGREAAGQPYRP
jgi:hypothetical protein